MNFKDTITVAATILGPAGIWFGWWLSERSARHRLDRAERAQAAGANAERAVEVVHWARRLASMSRSLSHGMYLRGTTGVRADQLTRMVTDFNQSRDHFRDAVLRARLLGPQWLLPAAAEVEEKGQALTSLIFDLQKKVTPGKTDEASKSIPEMDEAVEALATVVSQHLSMAPDDPRIRH